MKKTKIIIDCDPGHDDAIAIMVAGNHPAIDLLALTTVAGNQTLNKTKVNALHVCEHLELDIPVYAGMPLPLVREQVVAGNVHGESGLEAGPVHDVTCIAYLVAPELFTTQDMNVVVDINRGPCYGRTVCDTINCLKQPANCTVGTGIDLTGFWDLVFFLSGLP